MRALPIIDLLITLPFLCFAVVSFTINDAAWGTASFIAIVASCINVLTPSILLMTGHSIRKWPARMLMVIYSAMALMIGWILLYDITYGPWWWMLVLVLTIVAVLKSWVLLLQRNNWPNKRMESNG